MATLRRFCQLRSYRQGAWVVLPGQLAPLLSRGVFSHLDMAAEGRQGRQLQVGSCRFAARPEQHGVTDTLKGRLRSRPP